MEGLVAPEQQAGAEEQHHQEGHLEGEEGSAESTPSDRALASTSPTASSNSRTLGEGRGSPAPCGLAATSAGAAHTAMVKATSPASPAMASASARKRFHRERRVAPRAVRTATSWFR